MDKIEHFRLKKWMKENHIRVEDLADILKISSPHLSCFRNHHKTPSLLNALKIWYVTKKAFPLEDLLDPKRRQELEAFKENKAPV